MTIGTRDYLIPRTWRADGTQGVRPSSASSARVAGDRRCPATLVW